MSQLGHNCPCFCDVDTNRMAPAAKLWPNAARFQDYRRMFDKHQREIDAVIDCAGAKEMIQLGFGLLSVGAHYSSVGLVGDRIDIPLFPLVAREYTYHGSFWGNYNDLSEVVALVQEGKVRHTVKPIRFEEVNETLDLLREGGRGRTGPIPPAGAQGG